MRMRSYICVGTFVLVAILGPSTSQAASFFGLGDLPGGNFGSFALSVSADGSSVVGEGTSASGKEAFVWTTESGMIGLGDLSGGVFRSRAQSVSADGSIIVGDSSSALGPSEAFIWDQSSGMTGLGGLTSSSSSSIAVDVSGDGTIAVGLADGAEAFTWNANDGMTGLGFFPGGDVSLAGAISGDGSTVVGSSNSPVGSFGRAAVWTATGQILDIGDFAGGRNESNAIDVSHDGSTVVGWGTRDTRIEAFVWNSGNGMLGLGTLSGDSFAQAVSGDGSLVVGTSGPSNGREAFMWDATSGMRSLSELLTVQGVDLTGWTLQEATGISFDGTVIVGRGINPSSQPEAWVVNLTTVVPEPNSLGCIWAFLLPAAAWKVSRRARANL